MKPIKVVSGSHVGWDAENRIMTIKEASSHPHALVIAIHELAHAATVVGPRACYLGRIAGGFSIYHHQPINVLIAEAEARRITSKVVKIAGLWHREIENLIRTCMQSYIAFIQLDAEFEQKLAD